MVYEPQLITPFTDSGLSKYYKPFLVGNTAFPDIQDAYAWRGGVRKREGFFLFGVLPGGDAPVQGLKNWVNPSTLNESLIAFSQTKSYLWNALSDTFDDISFLAFVPPALSGPGTAFSWTNGPNDYFWESNHAGSMWITNNKLSNWATNQPGFAFWNGTPGSLGASGGWSIMQPTVNGTTQLNACLIVLPYKGRLVVLNTTEGSATFPSRARWSQLGTPYTSNAPATTITNIAPGSPTVITVTELSGFVVGESAGITGVLGTMGPKLNFNQYIVTAKSAASGPGTITITVSTVGLTYTSGGFAQGPGTTTRPSTFGGGTDIFGWRDDIPGRGGFIDADTSERIVSAEIVKDTLIVAFQRSTWRLKYTGNEILPFIWERLNTNYGAESTYSNIAFDDAALFFSRYGFIASSTNDVARIDENIPDDSFSVQAIDASLTGLSRIHGIRDYYRQTAYWTFESVRTGDSDQIYVYNYLDKSWAIFNPSVGIRTFGYFYNNEDFTWSALSGAKDTWENLSDIEDTWQNYGGGQNTGFPFIVGGDADGNVYQMFEFFANPGTDNGTEFNFTIATKRFNPYLKQGLKARIGYVDIYCTTNIGGEITLQHFTDDQVTDPILTKTVEIYSRGVVAISSITPGVTTTITTATPHNLPTTHNIQVNLSGIYGTIGPPLNNTTPVATVTGATTFTVPIDTSSLTYTSSGFVWSAPFDNGQAKYVRVYLGAIAHMHQFVLTLSESQLTDPVKGRAQFELQGLVVWSRPVGRIRG